MKASCSRKGHLRDDALHTIMVDGEFGGLRPNMSAAVTRSCFRVVSIPYISEGHPMVFPYGAFLACSRICLNTNLPRLNFLFIPI